MFRLITLASGVLSLIFFLKPQYFSSVKTSGDKVLGIKTLNQTANIETVKTALMIHCINKQTLPKNLNELYSDELSSEKYLNLEEIFFYSRGENCEFKLTPK